MTKQIFNKDTLVSWGVLITLLGAMFSFGVMHQKTNDLVIDVQEIKLAIKELDNKFDQLNARQFSQLSPNLCEASYEVK